MIVALTMRVVEAATYLEKRDAMSHDWPSWFKQKDWTLLPVSNALAEPGEYAKKLGAEALLLTGGNDLVCRAENPSSFSELRNRTEAELIKSALSTNLPILGICRGLHMLNKFFGGEVIEDIGAAKASHVAQNHILSICDTIGGTLKKTNILTNSFHEQAITQDGLGKDLVPFAISEDGFVEGVYHKSRPIIGIQWHPERANPAFIIDDLLIRNLFEKGAFWRDKH